MTFQLARRTRTVLLVVLVWPESGFRERAARVRLRAGAVARPGLAWDV